MANQGRAVVLVANKWDRVAANPNTTVTAEEFAADMSAQLRQVRGALGSGLLGRAGWG